jgi:hypothetical protein
METHLNWGQESRVVWLLHNLRFKVWQCQPDGIATSGWILGALMGRDGTMPVSFLAALCTISDSESVKTRWNRDYLFCPPTERTPPPEDRGGGGGAHHRPTCCGVCHITCCTGIVCCRTGGLYEGSLNLAKNPGFFAGDFRAGGRIRIPGFIKQALRGPQVAELRNLFLPPHICGTKQKKCE